jgi:signal transduction histidine kinase
MELEVERLNELIGNLLKLARLEGGADLIKAKPLMLDLLIGEVAQDADFEARSRNRSVRVSRLDSCSIQGNEELIRSAVENVTRNAVNYTAEGTEVELHLPLNTGAALSDRPITPVHTTDAEVPS